jgi:hypothetical protein
MGDINALDQLSSFTISAWPFMDPAASGSIISDWNTDVLDGWGLEILPVGELYLSILNTSDGYITSRSCYLGYYSDWHHVVAVYDGTQATNDGKAKLYIDGINVTLTHDGPAIPSTLNSNIGAFKFFSRDVGTGVRGYMDEVSFYNRPLTSTEISQLYLRSAPTLISGLLGLWHINVPAGTSAAGSVIDHSTNGYHGSPAGALVFGPSP